MTKPAKTLKIRGLLEEFSLQKKLAQEITCLFFPKALTTWTFEQTTQLTLKK